MDSEETDLDFLIGDKMSRDLKFEDDVLNSSQNDTGSQNGNRGLEDYVDFSFISSHSEHEKHHDEIDATPDPDIESKENSEIEAGEQATFDINEATINFLDGVEEESETEESREDLKFDPEMAVQSDSEEVAAPFMSFSEVGDALSDSNEPQESDSGKKLPLDRPEPDGEFAFMDESETELAISQSEAEKDDKDRDESDLAHHEHEPVLESENIDDDADVAIEWQRSGQRLDAAPDFEESDEANRRTDSEELDAPLILPQKSRSTRSEGPRAGPAPQEENEAIAQKKPFSGHTKKQNIFKEPISLSVLFENTRLLGLDIGVDSIKYVHLKKGPLGVKLINCGIYPIRQTGAEESEEERKEVIARTLSENLNVKIFKNTLINSAVSGLEVLFKNIQVPRMNHKELEKAVPWACRKDFPFPIESTTFEYKVLNKKSKRKEEKWEVFVVAAQYAVIENHLEILRQANIMPHKISTIPVALWNGFLQFAKPDVDKCCLVVEIGKNASHIVFVSKGELQFAREISTAGADFTQALTGAVFVEGKEIVWDEQRSEIIKKKYGFPDSSEDEETEEGIPLTEITAMMGPVFEKLVKEIQRTIDFFKEKHKEASPEKIFLTGGGALLKNLTSRLESELNLPVEDLNPFNTIPLKKFRKQDLLRSWGPRFAVAVGLALDKHKELNLLPDKLKEWRVVQYFKRLYKYVFVILLLSMILMSQNTSEKLARIKEEFAEARSQYELIAPKREQYMNLQQEIRELQKVKEDYDATLDTNVKASNHLKAISHLIRPNMTLTSLNIEHRQAPSNGKQNVEQEILVLNGIAFENNSMEGINLAKFLLDLKNSSYFNGIYLRTQKIREDGSLQFTIECEI